MATLLVLLAHRRRGWAQPRATGEGGSGNFVVLQSYCTSMQNRSTMTLIDYSRRELCRGIMRVWKPCMCIVALSRYSRSGYRGRLEGDLRGSTRAAQPWWSSGQGSSDSRGRQGRSERAAHRSTGRLQGAERERETSRGRETGRPKGERETGRLKGADRFSGTRAGARGGAERETERDAARAVRGPRSLAGLGASSHR